MQKTKRLKLKSILSLIVIWLTISAIIMLLHRFSLFEQLENSSLDFKFKHFTIADKADSTIILVAIDNQSLEFANQNETFWPWSRDFYALITEYLTNCGAKQVIFDIQFNEADYNRGNLDSTESDNLFASEITQNGKIILSAQALNISEKREDLAIPSLQVHNISPNYPVIYQSLSAPLEKFSRGAAGVGLINIVPDKDGVVRRVPLFYKIASEYYPQISYLAWLKQINTPLTEYHSTHLQVEDTRIPLLDGSNYLINWYGKGDVDGVFKYIPFSALMQSAVASKYKQKQVLDDSFFQDKTLIIGATAPGLLDLKTAPVSKILPGMEIWATILSNLKNADFIKIIPNYLIYLLLIILVLAVILIFKYSRMLYAHLGLFLILLLLHLLIYYSWIKYRANLPWFIFVIAIVLTYLIMLLVNYLVEGKEKTELKRIFSRYVHPDLVDILVNSSADFEMGGKEVEATVLFSDIYDFTSYSEKLKPKEIVTELNNYFEKFTAIILSNHGMLDKFTGDGLMALFGSPLIKTDHADLACKVALTHKKYAEALSKDDAASHFSKGTRIGINTGNVVIGNIGSTQRTDYTAIGDAVNLSARLEGVNKIFKTSIIIGENTWQQVKDNYICRELDKLKVKGKSQPTTIYELICTKEEENASLTHLLAQYKKALSLYQEANFEKAIVIFDDLSKSQSKDYPSFVMAERCRFLTLNPPEKWDGIFTLTVK